MFTARYTITCEMETGFLPFYGKFLNKILIVSATLIKFIGEISEAAAANAWESCR